MAEQSLIQQPEAIKVGRFRGIALEPSERIANLSDKLEFISVMVPHIYTVQSDKILHGLASILDGLSEEADEIAHEVHTGKRLNGFLSE